MSAGVDGIVRTKYNGVVDSATFIGRQVLDSMVENPVAPRETPILFL